jgi:hypothetical protein
MKYEDFEKFIREKCMYDTIYDGSDGRQVLIIQMLDAYGMVNKAQREWVGLTDDEVNKWELPESPTVYEFAQFVESKLKEKNT